MVAVVSGNSLGLFNSSLALPGTGGSVGNPKEGRANERVYVNSSTGNLVIQVSDETLAAVGLDIGLVRTYNSQGLMNDDNADNWRLGVHESLSSPTGTVNTAGSTVTKTFGDGAAIAYTYDTALGYYVSTHGDGAHDTLSWNSGTSQWTWTNGTTRAVQVFNSTGRLLSSRDADGNTTTYTYTGSLLTQIADASGQNTFLDYTGSNLTAIRVVSSGVTQTITRYTYDASNRLSTVRVDLSPGDNSVTDNNVFLTTYTYDGTSKRVASIAQGSNSTVGSTVSFTYVLVGSDYRLQTYTDGEGKITTFTYTGAPIATQVDITSPLSQVTSFVNDTQGRLTSVLSPTVGGVRLETRYTYDTSGNVTTITEDPAGANRVTTNEYDSKGNLTLTRDSIGNTITRTYSATNQLLTETLYTVPDPDGAGTGQPSGSLTTRYAYDSENHLRFVISSDGRVTEHRYNTAGSNTSTIKYTGSRYAVSGLPPTTALTESQLTTWVGTQTLTLTERIDYAYDFRGNVQTVTAFASTDATGVGVAAGSSVTRFVYDQRGRLLSTIDPRGESTTGDPNDFATTFTYDGLGRVLTSVRWTATGNVTTLSNAYNDGTRTATATMPNGLVTTTVYDRVGRQLTVSASNGSPLGTTTYAYDAAGRLRMVTDPVGIKTHTVYDAAGRKTFTVDGNGTLTEFIYDRLSNIVKTVEYAVAANTALLTDGSGNPLGNVDVAALRTSANGQAAQNRISRTVYDAAHRAVYTIGPTGAVTKNTYDGASRLTDQLSYATNVSIPAATDELTLTAGGGITGVTLTTSADDRLARIFYDSDGLLAGKLDGAGYLIKNTYDAAGHLIQTIGYANATAVGLRATGTLSALEGSITADAAKDIVTYAFYDGQGRRIGALDGEKYLTEWRYDAAGNVSQEIRYPTARTFTGMPTFGGVVPANTTGAHITSYQYNERNQLTLETSFENIQTQYKYDNVGNLIQTTRALGDTSARVTQARYDALGRVTAELTAEGSAAIVALGASPTQTQIDNVWNQYQVKYAYDTAGRRISTTDQYGNVRLFFYDSDNRQRFSVLLVGGGLGEVSESRYNALGQLTDDFAYSTRVSTTGFASGDVNGTLTATVATAVAAITDPTKDKRVTYTYTLAGRVATEVTTAGTSITHGYNAFGDLTSSSQVIDTTPATTTLNHQYTYDQRALLLTTRRDPSGLNVTESRTYDAFGRVKTATDARGNVTQFSYDRMGRTLAITDPFSKTDEITYDAFSRVLTTKDKLLQTTTYVYDDAQKKVTVTMPEGTSVSTVHNVHGQTATITDARGTVITHEYDANGQLKRVYDSIGNISQQTYDRAGRGVDSVDAKGVITRVTYDAASRVLTSTVDPGGLALTTTYVYDAQGRTITRTDPRGVVTQTAYDQNGNVTGITVDPPGLNLRTTFTYDKRGEVKVTTEGVGSGNPRTVTYQYDKLGRRISETVVLGSGQPDAVTQYKYDANGNVTRVINASNFSTWYVYDASNQLRYTIDALGGVTQNTYNDAGRVTSTRRHATAVGYLASLGDVVTLANLSSLGTPATSTADRLEETVYNRDGRAIYTIKTLDSSGNGVVVQNDYDQSGNIVHRRMYANAISSGVARTATGIAAALSPSATLDRETFTTYDIRNRASFDIDAAGSVARNEYDAAGNVIARTQFFTTRATTSTPTEAQMVSWAGTNSNAADRITRDWYDAAGRDVFTLDAEGYLTETRYNDATRVEETFSYYSKPSATLTTTSTLTQVRNAIVTNPNDRYTKNEFDKGGRVFRTTKAISGSENAVEQFTYDAVGNQLSYTNAKGSTWNYTYDANRRLLEELGPAVAIWGTNQALSPAPTAVRIATRMTYDALGNVLTRTEAYGRTEARTTSYEYDQLGRQTRTIYPRIDVYNAPANDETRVGTAVVRTETAVLAPDNVVTYNTLGDAVVNRDVASNYAHKVYDRAGRLKYEVDVEQYVTEHVYDSFGNETSTIRYTNRLNTGSLTLSAEWTAANITANLTTSSTSDRTLTTQYDRVNRATRITQPAVHNFLPNSGSTSGGTVVDNTGAATLYDYNAFGEITRHRQLATASTYADTYYYYDRRGLKTAVIDPRGYLAIAEYDAIGNRTRSVEYAKPLGTPPTTPNGSYSGLSTSTAAANPNDAAGYDRETLYTYDRLNRLKTESLINVEYTTISGDVTTRMTNGTRTTTYDYDAVGNRIAQTDASGAVTRTYYDALGRVIAVAEPLRNLGTSTTATTIAYNWTPSGYIETFQYRPTGASTWTTLSAYGTVNLGALVNGTYDWYLSTSTVDMYGTPIPVGYATGTLTVNGASSSSSLTSSSNAPIPTMTATTPPPSTAIVTPLSEMRRDAFGNLVIHIQWGGGASTATAATFAGSSTAADRVTRVTVDRYGNTLRTVDPEGGTVEQSYTVRGEVAKEWQLIQNVDGGTDALVTIYQYDKLGQQTAMIEPQRLVGATVVARTDVAYNAFGEIVTKTLNGTQTEYYDYDKAGRVWRSNSGDGVHKVYLYDLLGNNTAEIRSQTRNLKTDAGITNAAAAFNLAPQHQMRTETRYDLMGHALEQRQVTFNAPAAQEGINTPILFGNLTMPNPANAVYQQVYYPDPYNPYVSYVLNPTSYANNGGWYQVSPPSSSNPTGTYARVAEASYSISQRGFIYWNAPTQSGLTRTFEYRSGAGAWQSLGVNQVNTSQIGVDISGLSNGSYEYRISYTRAGDTGAYAIATGTFSVTNASVTTLSTATGAAVGGIGLTSSSLSGTSLSVTWNGSTSGPSTLEIKLTSSSTWQTVSGVYVPGDMYTAPYNYATATGITPGTYDYRITHTTNGRVLAMGTGTVSVSSPSSTTTGSATPSASWGNAIGPLSASTSTSGGGSTTISFSWSNTGYTEVFRYRPVNGSWVYVGGGGSASLGALANGNYEYVLEYGTYDMYGNYFPVGSAAGTFIVNGASSSRTQTSGSPLLNLTATTPPLVITTRLQWPVDSSIAGTPYFYYRQGSGSWINLGISTSGGNYFVQANNLSGNYEWKVEYWVVDGYSSYTTATATGTFSVSGTTATITSQVGTPSYLSGVTASGSNLLWARALQSGETLTVSLNNGAINLTPTTSNGTNYSASFNGVATGTYSYEIAYWKSGAKRVVGSGTLSITTNVTPSTPTISQPTAVGQITGFYDGGNGMFAWTTAASGGTVQARYRAVGATTWTSISAVAFGGAYAINVNSPTQINGSIEVEVRYIAANGSPYRIGYGTTTITRSIQTTGSVTDTTSSTLAPVPVTPRLQQTFDRWGNVLSSISAALAQTNYRYNQSGAVAEVQLPTSDIVSTINAGVAAYFGSRPIQRNYFDVLGRVIATRDGNANRVTNGKMNKVQYNEAGQVIAQTYADGGTKSYVLDTFGQQIQVMDSLGYRTRMAYDRTGNLTAQAREVTTSGFLNAPPTDLTPRNSTSIVRNDYTYDRAGHRLTETTGEVMNGTSNPETTKYLYDLVGNVIKRTTPRGRTTTYEYDINGNKTLERNALNQAQSWTYDNYGRALTQTDLGGAVATFNYNAITKYLISQTNTLGQSITYYYDSAGNLTKAEDRGTAGGGLAAVSRDTEISYDAAGRRARERVVLDGLVHQDTHITYDSQDRIAQLSDLRYRVTYRYDDSGNRSRIKATYYDHSGIAQTQDLWYTYDAMNRVKVSQGVNSAGNTETSGTVGINTVQGIELTYDTKGQRTSARQYGQKLNRVNGTYSYSNDYSTEFYGYDGAGRLVTTDRSMTQTVGSTTTQTTQRTDTRTFDKAARELWVTSTEFEVVNNVLTAVSRARGTNYDDDGRTVSQVTQKNGVRESSVIYGDSTNVTQANVSYTDPWTGVTVNTSWGHTWTPGYDVTGTLRGYIVVVYDTATTAADDTAYISKYLLNYRNGAAYQETSTSVTSVKGNSASYPQHGVPQSGATGRTYNVNGELVSTYDTRDGSKNRYFANDAGGQAMTVVQGQYDGLSGRWTPTQAFQYALANTGAYNVTKSQHFFFALGQQVGSYGQLSNGSTFKANFDVNYTPVSDNYPDAVPSEVIAQKGDTLRVLAARLFGDQNLWYLIAEENGLTSPDAPLEPGTVLRVPSEVVSLSNASGSFKPFDAQEAIGDTSPTQPMPPAPKPKKKKGCGILGMILMIVVVVVVTIYTAGALTSQTLGGFSAMMSAGASALGTVGGLTIGQAALAAAVGSIAGQAFGIATGIQDKFSWKGVALAAVGGAVTAGLGNWGAFGNAMEKVASVNPYLGAGVSAAAGNAITQGVSVAVGLQKKFDWKSVAASAIAAPLAKLASDRVGAWVTKGGEKAYQEAVATGAYTAGRFAADAAASLTTAAVRSSLGGKFDISQVAADIFGNALANSLVSKMQRIEAEKRLAAEAAEANEITLTQSGGGTPVMLPDALSKDPQLRALADAVKDDNIPQLSDRMEAAQDRTDDRQKARDDVNNRLTLAQQTLATATAANDPRAISRAQRTVNSLTRQLQRRDERLTQAIAQEALATQRYAAAYNDLAALQNYLVGKSITVVDGTKQVPAMNRNGTPRLDRNGQQVYRTVPNTLPYTIRGPNPSGTGYASMEEAAVDAIAMSWAIDRATGRNIEYAGYIYEDTTGQFTYDRSLSIGRGTHRVSVSAPLAGGNQLETRILLPDPARRTEVAMFHIHPRNGQLDADANKYFGPGDLYASQRASNTEGRDLPHYLGASDGAVRVLRSPQSQPAAPAYVQNTTSTHKTPPLTAYQVVKPPGYFPVR